MRLLSRCLFTGGTLFLLCAQSVLATTAHPLLSPYPGASDYSKKHLDYSHFDLPTGMPAPGSTDVPTKAVLGDLSQIFYTLQGVSTYKAFKNYQQAVATLGFTVLFACEGEQCGDENASRAFGNALSPSGAVYNYYRNPYILIAEGKGNKGKIHLALFFGGYDSESAILQVIVEEEPLDTGLLTINASYLQNQPGATEASTTAPNDLHRDHPLISRYPGARIYQDKTTDFAPYNLPVALGQPDLAITTRALTGDLSQITYNIDKVSTLKVAENYRAALAAAGFTLDFECALAACGNESQARQLGGLLASSGSVYNDYRQPYFFAAHKNARKGPVYVSLFIGGLDEQVSVQQVIMEVEALDTGLVTVSAESLKRDLEETGKASIYGIHFDTGLATIRPESADTLAEITKLLTQMPALKLYVVGHTDDTGELGHNQALSAQRADAVVKALTERGIGPDRLLSFGAGPYAPVASNNQDAGKARNRRVELVRRLK